MPTSKNARPEIPSKGREEIDLADWEEEALETAWKKLEKKPTKNEWISVEDQWTGTAKAFNAFCPTGTGGGVDPTCSPGRASTESASEPKDTEEKFKVGGKWTAERVRVVHEPALAKMFEGVKKAEGPPVLYMTGGGYGSGKSTLLDKFPGTVGFPSGDKAGRADPDALKKDIPEYVQKASGKNPDKNAASYVHEESAHLSKEGVSRGLKGGYDMIYDTSGDTAPDKLHGKVQEFRKLGATRVEANYAFPGSIKEAQRRADSRAAKGEGGLRRFVPPAVLSANHAEVARCWLRAAERKTFDKLGLWSTAGEFGKPPSLIAMAVGGKIEVVDKKLFDEFKKIGGM